MLERHPTISEPLDALARQTVLEFDVLIPDSGSTYTRSEVIVGHTRRVWLVDPNQEREAANVNKLGPECSSGDPVLYSEADGVADTSWAEHLLAALNRFEPVGGNLGQSRVQRVQSPQVQVERR